MGSGLLAESCPCNSYRPLIWSDVGPRMTHTRQQIVAMSDWLSVDLHERRIENDVSVLVRDCVRYHPEYHRMCLAALLHF